MTCMSPCNLYFIRKITEPCHAFSMPCLPRAIANMPKLGSPAMDHETVYWLVYVQSCLRLQHSLDAVHCHIHIAQRFAQDSLGRRRSVFLSLWLLHFHNVRPLRFHFHAMLRGVFPFLALLCFGQRFRTQVVPPLPTWELDYWTHPTSSLALISLSCW